MRIGLFRHFPVDEELPSGWMTSAELLAWRERYDTAPISTGPFDLGNVAWQACIASDLSRALDTARVVFSGAIEPTALLREPAFMPFGSGELRLPFTAWRWWIRFAWLTGHPSQRACRDEFREQVLAMTQRLCDARQDTLVVAHAGMLAYLSAALRRQGFVGPQLRMARFATAYVYQRP